MNELIKPIAKILDISASELEKIVSSLNMNAPQIYERLLHEWQVYRFFEITAYLGWIGLLMVTFGNLFLMTIHDDTEEEKTSNKDTKAMTYVGILFISLGLLSIVMRPILAPHIDLIMQLK